MTPPTSPSDDRHPDRPTPDDLPTPVESLQDQSDEAVPTARQPSPADRADGPPRHSSAPSPAAPPDTDVRESTPNSSGPKGAAGGMGVSSERVGHAGPGQTSTDGLNPTGSPDPDAAADLPPEQSPGGPEDDPVGLDPKAGYPSADPRSEEKQFETRGNVQG